MALVNFDQFIKNHLGKAMDYDGVAGVQCVDLAKYYLKEVFGISPGAWGDAHCYYDNFNNLPLLKANFTRIKNTPEFIPQKGDIVVWSSALSSGGWGHIAIADGVGTTTYFYSYDQNWTGKHDACTRIKHNYTAFLGVLRPKDQTKVHGKIKGDINGDGKVSVADITKIAAHVQGSGTIKDTSVADMNNDGKVNVTDVLLVAEKVKGTKK